MKLIRIKTYHRALSMGVMMIEPLFPRQPPDSGDPPPTYDHTTSVDSDSEISKCSVFPKVGKVSLDL